VEREVKRGRVGRNGSLRLNRAASGQRLHRDDRYWGPQHRVHRHKIKLFCRSGEITWEKNGIISLV